VAVLAGAGVLLGSLGPVATARAQELDCLVQPRELLAVSSPVEGVIERVMVDRGDLITQGTVVAVLESSAERAAVEIARARAGYESGIKSNKVRVDFGQRRWERTDEMYKKDLIPLKDLDEAETQKVLAELGLAEAQENKRLAELELTRAQAALALRTIASPISGVVVERMLAPGEFAKQAPILRVAQLDPLRVEVFVPVALLGRIHAGTRALVIPESPFNQAMEASVTVVDKVADAASGTYGVRLELPNPGNRVPAGLKCKVRFTDAAAPAAPRKPAR